MDLCIGDYNTCYIQKIYINGAVGCLVYDREKEKRKQLHRWIEFDKSRVFNIISNIE